jgi:protein-disulfide isomerase
VIRENPDVRFVFKEYPIFGQVSDTAARMSLTPAAKTKSLELYQLWMADRGLDERALDRHLTDVGLDPAAVRRAAENPAIERQLVDVAALARAIGLEGTPAFIVGDTLIPGADVKALRAAIARAKASRGRPADTSAT